MNREHQRIALLRELFGAPSEGVGIGDDAATLRVSEELVVSVDASVENVHFRREWMSLEDIGFRATMAALSDLAAMGSRPRGILSSLTLPADISDADLLAIGRGQKEAAGLAGCSVIGGNLTRADELSIHTTVLGEATRPPLRAGAQQGDQVWLAGALGLARAGLLSLQTGRGPSQALLPCLQAFRRPHACLTQGIGAHRRGCHALIDISDGLVADLGHMARASNLTLVVLEGPLLSPALVRAAGELGHDPVELALVGGEDYALVATSSTDLSEAGFVPIGRVESGTGEVVVVGPNGRRIAEQLGFDHFAD